MLVLFLQRQQITHGDFCLLVWMVLVPLANLISRFFKDFAEISGLGLGFWIVVRKSCGSLFYNLLGKKGIWYQ